jgi:hypothetical protein
MTDMMNPARAGGAAGSGNCHRRLASDNRASPPKSVLNQEQSCAWLRRQHHVEHLHRLGPSPLGHFIKDIEKGADIDATLEAYAKLDADFIKALGGDKFVPSLFAIGGGRR